jgi:nucleotide-binding universal stress UspA family protein
MNYDEVSILSEKKLESIETMFKKTTKPKMIIDEYPKIERIGVIVDSSPQGFKALQVATSLAKRLQTSFSIIISDSYHDQLEALSVSIKRELFDLETTVKDQEEVKPEDKLSIKLIEHIKDSGAQILVTGVPLFRTTEDESLGTYVFRLLRAREIHANFLLVSGKKHIIADSVLAFVSVEQQPASIVALYRRALSFATEKTKFKIVGIVDDKVIETVARLDLPSDDPEAVLDLEGAKSKLITKMEETLESISLKKEIDDVIILGSPTWDVVSGHVAEIVRQYLEEINPGIIFVRSVAEISENLDPFAAVITRQVLGEGYNCLVVWD